MEPEFSANLSSPTQLPQTLSSGEDLQTNFLESSDPSKLPSSPPTSHKKKSASRLPRSRFIIVGGNKFDSPIPANRHKSDYRSNFGSRRTNLSATDSIDPEDTPINLRLNLRMLDKEEALQYDFGDPFLEQLENSQQFNHNEISNHHTNPLSTSFTSDPPPQLNLQPSSSQIHSSAPSSPTPTIPFAS
ncbi:hypothetical protein O181_094756 [Austropuccinia psidii MF-1]|uniref:Uncharacterized protein n=1 Tax=Austropuccinia psidii MF-1 TaxID=1389203 RepID=A0A9Q3J3U6_9BASI|nr:hypothetical protein [Austropuccinia psidii MF-1]